MNFVESAFIVCFYSQYNKLFIGAVDEIRIDYEGVAVGEAGGGGGVFVGEGGGGVCLWGKGGWVGWF